MKRTPLLAILVGSIAVACGGGTEPTDSDVTGPIVTLSTPSGGAKVTGVVALAATAEDSNGIAGVRFRVDGVDVGSEDLAGPYGVPWNSTLGGDGVHVLTARARDSAGNVTTSSEVTVQVDNTSPAVTLTAPGIGTKVVGTVALTATAADAGGLAGVTFKIDGVAVGTEDLSAPFSVDWNTTLTAEGVHTITATARDSVGKTTATAPVPVVVDNIPLGTVRVSLTAGGDVSLLDSLHVIIDSGAAGPPRTLAAFPLDSLVPPGAHTLMLTGLDPHCAITGSATRDANVSVDSVTTVSYSVFCGYGDVIAMIVAPLDTSGFGVQLRRPDGTLVGTPIRSTEGIFDVALSPDGRRLAYVTGIVLTTVHLRDLISGADEILVPLAGQVTRGVVAWSPDGSQLVYRDTTNGLAILTLAGGGSVPVPNGEQANAPDWSRDGNAIAFTGIRDTNQSVFRVAPSGTGLTQLTFPPFGSGDTEARWSPDGLKLILGSTRGGSSAIWISDADGGNLTQVTPGGAVEVMPHWSPMGDRIAFIRGNAVWVRTLSSGAESLVYNGGSSEIIGIDWAR